MKRDAVEFSHMLTEALYKIRKRESKTLQIIQDEIGYMLGRNGGRAIAYWRNNNIPSKHEDMIALARELVRRGNFDAQWAEQFVGASGFAYTEELNDRLFPEQIPSTLGTAPSIYNLPHKTFRRLIGREKAYRQIMQALEDTEGSWLVGIDGIGGIGKTTLALEVADQCVRQRRFQHVLWLQIVDPLSNVAGQETSFTFESILDGIGSQIGTPEIAKLPLEQKAQRIRAILQHAPTLLVVDNLDQADETQNEIIAKLRPFLNPSKAILTSRRRFVGEICGLHLQGLALAAGIEFIRQEAAQKWVEPVAQSPDADLADIVKQTGGSPLALKLLVSQLSYLPFDYVIRRLSQQMKTQTQALEHNEYFRFYQFVFLDNWNLLHKISQRLLVSLAHFEPIVGGTLMAAQIISNLSEPELNDGLDQLWRLSFLEIGNTRGVRQLRYALHPLTQHFVRAVIVENQSAETSGESWNAVWLNSQQRFIRYWGQYLAEHENDFGALAAEEQNILRALQVSSADNFVQGVCLLLPYLVDIKGRLSIARKFVNRALTLAKGDNHSTSEIILLLYLGQIEEKEGNYPLAEKHTQKAMQQARHNKQLKYLSILLGRLGFLAKLQGQYQQAVDYFQEGIDIAIQENATEQLVHLLGRQSGTYVSQGNWELAKVALEQALTKKEKVAEKEMIPIYNNLGITKQHIGDYHEAEALYLQGLRLAESTGNKEYMCMLLVNLGYMATEHKGRREARDYYRRALEIAREIGHKSAVCVLLCNIGFVESDPDQARAYFEEAIALSRELNHPEYLISSLDGLGHNLADRGDFAGARIYMQEGLDLAVSINHRQTCRLYMLCGDIEWQQNQNYELAKDAFESALSHAYEVDDLPFAGHTLVSLSALETEFGNLQQAKAYLTKSKEIAETLDNQLLALSYQRQSGELQFALREYEQAITHFTTALEPARQLESFIDVALTLYGLARCSALMGKHKEARRLAQESLSILERYQNRTALLVTDWLAQQSS